MQEETLILIPTLNEKANLEKLIPGIYELMPEASVLIADDDSQDGTSEFIKSLGYRNLFILERKSNFGYGKACLDGFKWALDRGFKYILTMDADFSHDYNATPYFIEKLNDYDVVIGSRYIPGGSIKNWKWHR